MDVDSEAEKLLYLSAPERDKECGCKLRWDSLGSKSIPDGKQTWFYHLPRSIETSHDDSAYRFLCNLDVWMLGFSPLLSKTEEGGAQWKKPSVHAPSSS